MGNASTPTASAARLHVLDVRPVLDAGGHPVDAVMTTVEGLPPAGVLEILAPFEPVPLMDKLRARGCSVESHCVGTDAWLVRAARGALPPWEDLTALEAPQPLERVLKACALLTEGRVYTAWLPRRPMMLFPQLNARGLCWEAVDHADGTCTLWVQGGKP